MNKRNNMYELCRGISNDLSNKGFKTKDRDFVSIEKCHDIVSLVFNHIFKKLDDYHKVNIIGFCDMKRIKCKKDKSYIEVKETRDTK